MATMIVRFQSGGRTPSWHITKRYRYGLLGCRRTRYYTLEGVLRAILVWPGVVKWRR